MAVPDIYISRDVAERFLDTLAASFSSPAKRPVVFHVWGLGGVGKSTVLAKAMEGHRIAIKPDLHAALSNKGISLANLGRYEDAIRSYDAALAIKPNAFTWGKKGLAMSNLGRYEDAIVAYNKALALKPDYDNALYNKACAYALWNKPDEALEFLQKAIELAPEKYIELAKTDTDFDSLREDPRFQSLIQSPSQNS